VPARNVTSPAAWPCGSELAVCMMPSLLLGGTSWPTTTGIAWPSEAGYACEPVSNDGGAAVVRDCGAE